MLGEPTVFILGAGASVPYDFPSGPELRARVSADLAAPQGFTRSVLQEAGYDFHTLSAFGRLLRECDCDTIDEFLQLEVARQFIEVAKAAMAAVLVPLETEASSRPRGTQSDEAWYSYLFRNVLPNDPGIATNLRVITLNFDRSFEAALEAVVRPRYGLHGDRLIQTLHLHGQLAGEFPATRAPGPEGVLDEASKAAEAAIAVGQSAQTIRLVTDGPDPQEVRAAKDWITEATNVCFLGCGYHRFTLDRLDIPDALAGKRVAGTTHKMDDGRRSQLIARFRSTNPNFPASWSILTFLKNDPLIHFQG